MKMSAPTQGTLSTLGARDNETRGSRTNLANIGIRVQERKNSRQAIEQQVNKVVFNEMLKVSFFVVDRQDNSDEGLRWKSC